MSNAAALRDIVGKEGLGLSSDLGFIFILRQFLGRRETLTQTVVASFSILLVHFVHLVII